MPLTGDAKREYQRNWIKARRDTWFEANGPCVECGSWENLEVDHVDPSTKDPRLKTTIKAVNLWSMAKAKMEAELSKCVVKCTDCHKVKSADEHPKGVDHQFAKLTPEAVRDIRKQLEAGITPRVIGEQYGVDGGAIRSIRRGATWSHVI